MDSFRTEVREGMVMAAVGEAQIYEASLNS